MPEQMDPRVLLALTLIHAGIMTVEKIKELWGRAGVDSEVLATIQTEADTRLDLWKAM